jgi:ankyrin repeat protein
MKADVNVRNASDATPLHLAVKHGNEAAVGALVQFQHCNVNYQVCKT